MRPLPLLIVLMALGLLGCGTSSGSLFDTVVEADQSESQESSEQFEPEEELWKIRSDPSGAEIYIDNRHAGWSPIDLANHPPGRYKVEARKEGYRSTFEWFTYSGGEDRLKLYLEPITGYLDLQTQPSDTTVLLGEQVLTTGLTEVVVGSYHLVVSAFGYTSQETLVTISEDRTTTVRLSLDPAQFELTDVSLSRHVFNPTNPGLIGKTVLSFNVSTYGSGRAWVIGSDGATVWSKELARFTDWGQRVIWDGRDTNGRVVPDGAYTLVLETKGEDSPAIEREQTELTVDSSLIVTYRAVWSGISGLLYAPTPETLPEGNIQLSRIVQAHVEPEAYRAPVSIALRVGLHPETELNASLSVFLENVEPLPYSISVGAKHPLLRLGGHLGADVSALARVTYQHGTGTDSLGNFTGLSAGLPSALRLGRLMLVVSPEIVVSPWLVTYDSTFNDNPGVNSWLYTRAGILYDLSWATVGASLTARTEPFGTSFAMALPVQTAVEVHVLIPGTQFFVTAAVSGEIEARDNYYLSTGVGVGILE